MEAASVHASVAEIARRFAADRHARQRRSELDAADFAELADAGFLMTGVSRRHGGLFESIAASTRPVADMLRVLAGGDSSVALVCAMHPAVLSFWLVNDDAPEDQRIAWDRQRDEVAATVRQGAWWGTITSEPGSGGDVAGTRAIARPGDDAESWAITGAKHFGSGSGITSFMLTTAVPEAEPAPDWFFVDMRAAPWDGSTGARLTAPWDGHGMIATQSHGFAFEGFAATRLAWTGALKPLSDGAGPFIGSLFTAVIAGIVDTAIETARAQLAGKAGQLRPYERVEWTRAETEAWLVAQAYEGMLRAVETKRVPHADVLSAKLAVAELAESVTARLCRILGGGSFSRHSPFGFWFEDVRALGWLRPPWGLAFDSRFALSFPG